METMDQDKLARRALLGDHEAAKRLTDAVVLLPCCCGRKAHIKKRDKIISYKVCCGSLTCGNETLWWGDKGTAIRVWNTRAPILSAEEMEMLGGTE